MMSGRRCTGVLTTLGTGGMGRAFGLAALAAVAVAGGACTQERSTLYSVRGDPTPELDTLTERRDDMDNQMTVTNDENLRMFNEDLGRMFLLDRPSRLTPKQGGF